MALSAPSFSCDHCGAAVELHAARCPRCGKAFDAVRCPRCGHQGSPGQFSDGCPRCRYLAAPVVPKPGSTEARRSVFLPVMAVLLGLLAVAVLVAWVLRRP